MKKIIITLITVLLICSCVTEAGLAIDMRISEPVPRAYYVSEDSDDEFVVTPLAMEEPIVIADSYYVSPMVGAMLSVRANNNGANLKVESADIIKITDLTGNDETVVLPTSPSPTIEGGSGEDYILVTGSYEAPSLPPTTLEEETYNGHTRFLDRAVSSPSPSVYETSIWDVTVKPVSHWESEDGRGSAIIPYIEYGDDWDGEWEPGTWRDEEQFKPNNPGTYEVYGW